MLIVVDNCPDKIYAATTIHMSYSKPAFDDVGDGVYFAAFWCYAIKLPYQEVSQKSSYNLCNRKDSETCACGAITIKNNNTGHGHYIL